MKNRRTFLKSLGTTLASAAVIPLTAKPFLEASEQFDLELASDLGKIGSDEDFWAWVQNSYSSGAGFINLNNGGVSPQPTIVQNAFKRYTDICNDAPSYYMWRDFKKDVIGVKGKLADLAGVSVEEIAINRNATEAIDTIVNGLPLAEGDEIVISKFSYPNMKHVWNMREKRDGIKLNWVELPMPSENKAELVKRFTDQFNSKTKLVHITHLINWTGQVLPVREIADEAHKRGIEVLVDAAHSFAHLNFTIPDLNCDYLGTSLHKWLCAPFGTGMLYIKKEKIAKIYPSFANEEPTSGDIKKFENLGTHSVPSEVAIGQAINFHNAIGAARKHERLHQLKSYWIDQVKDLPKVKIYTPESKELSGALATFGIEGMKGSEISVHLQKKYQIHTTSISIENVEGVRVTPHVYTRFEDLDKLVGAIKSMVA